MVDGSRELPHSLSSYFSKPNRIYRSLVLLFSRDITCIASAVRLEKREREERHTPTHTQKVNIGFLMFVSTLISPAKMCQESSLSVTRCYLEISQQNRNQARDCRQHFACSIERRQNGGQKGNCAPARTRIKLCGGLGPEREWGGMEGGQVFV
jgi:hypothetical protein